MQLNSFFWFSRGSRRNEIILFKINSLNIWWTCLVFVKKINMQGNETSPSPRYSLSFSYLDSVQIAFKLRTKLLNNKLNKRKKMLLIHFNIIPSINQPNALRQCTSLNLFQIIKKYRRRMKINYWNSNFLKVTTKWSFFILYLWSVCNELTAKQDRRDVDRCYVMHLK